MEITLPENCTIGILKKKDANPNELVVLFAGSPEEFEDWSWIVRDPLPVIFRVRHPGIIPISAHAQIKEGNKLELGQPDLVFQQ